MAISPATHGIRGYASVFGVLDDRGTIVDRGAFADAVVLVAAGEVYPLVYAHSVVLDWFGTAKPIGVITRLEEDDHGLRYHATLHDTQEAHDVLEGVAGGSIAGASFSFDPLAWEVDDDDVEHFTRVHLYELGPCVWGANSAATAEVYALDEADEQDDEPADEPADDELAAALTEAAEEIAP